MINYCLHKWVNQAIDWFELFNRQFEFTIDSEKLEYKNEVHSKFWIFSDHVSENLERLILLPIRPYKLLD